jgi:hypothetical protein
LNLAILHKAASEVALERAAIKERDTEERACTFLPSNMCISKGIID